MNPVSSGQPPIPGLGTEIRHQQVALLYGSAPLPIVANAFNGLLLAYINTTLGTPTGIAYPWAAALIAIAAGRWLLVRAWRKASVEDRRADRWYQYFFIGTVLAAATWGIGAFLFMWRAPEAIYLFSGLVISGTVAGGIASLGPLIGIYRWFALLMLLPMAASVLLNAAMPLEWAFGGLTLFLLVILIRGAQSMHQTVEDSIRLRLEQQALLATVERSRDQAQDMVIELRQKEAALADSEERYRLIVDHSPTGILHYDNNLVITYCNRRFTEIVAAPMAALIGLDMNTLKDQRVLAPMRKALDGATARYEGGYVTTLDGKEVWISMSCSPLIGVGHQIDGGIAIVEDVTERRHDELALRESEARLQLMLETSPIAVRIAGNAGHKVLFANQRYGELIQASPETMLGADPGQYYARPEEYQEIMSVLLLGGQVKDRLVELMMPDGRTKWALASYLMLSYKGQQAVLGWFYDVTRQKEAEQQMEHLAMTDPLTGLHNRRSFMETAERELARALRRDSTLAIMMLDLDHFKSINDTHGHRVGDTVLQTFAQLCQQALRTFDIVGRLGGEEFAILLPETSLEQAWRVADRLRRKIETTGLPQEQGVPLHFTVSIGVAAISETTTNIDTLLSQADSALYSAKRTGRNRVCRYRQEQ